MDCDFGTLDREVVKLSEYIHVIIALVIIGLILAVICFAVGYAFEVLENRKLREEINKGFHYTLLFNKSLDKDVKFLENVLRPYRRLANKYGCSDAVELEKLLMDLQDKLYRKNEVNNGN